jgi:hypothetical protein
LKGCIWDSDGFKDHAKHSVVHEAIREFRLDFFSVLEIGRENFSAPFLKNLSGGLDFIWYCLPPLGRSGGILVGFIAQTINVKNIVAGDHCVKFHLSLKLDNFEWYFVTVYGAAQDAQKGEFLAELVRMCEDDNLLLLVGGDFYIIRRQEEKNNDNCNARWSFIFNAIIESLDLREIVLSGRQFTWVNRKVIPTYEKLDRVLTCVSWEQKFPLVSVRALTRAGSDHTPLLIDTSEQAHLGNKAHFSFELSWLKHEGFHDMVSKEWAAS